MHRQTINGTEAIILQPRVAKVLASICSSDETRDNINRVWATHGRLYATDGCQAFRWCESADESGALNGETIAEANRAGRAVDAHREALQKAAKVADSKQAIALPLDGSPDLIVLDANASYLALRRDDDDDREAAVEAKVPRHGRHGESNDQAPEFDRSLLPPERANGRDGRLAGYDPTIQPMYLKTVHDLASALTHNTKTTVHCRVRMPEPLNDPREVRGPACFELRESDTPGAMQFFIMPTRLPGAAIADGKPVGEIKTSGGICPSCGATLARELHSSCGCYTDVRPVETA